jgi:hypothetical protein
MFPDQNIVMAWCALAHILFTNTVLTAYVKWVPCHHSMVRPQFVDGGNCLQLWIIARNTLNKQPWAAYKGWSSSLGLDVGLRTPQREK